MEKILTTQGSRKVNSTQENVNHTYTKLPTNNKLNSIKEEKEQDDEIQEENENAYNFDEYEYDENDKEDMEKYEEADYQEVQNRLKEFQVQGEEGENEYAEVLEKYFEYLKGEYNNLLLLDEHENKNAEILALKSERLDEDIERAHTLIEEYKEENLSLESRIKLETKQNPTIHSNLDNASIIEKIYITTQYTDLTQVPKFSKFLNTSNDKNLIESFSMLRGGGGVYLKRLGSILYFLHLLKERYKTTKIPQEILEIKDNFLNNFRFNIDDIRAFESKVKVIYNNDSFLINIDSDEKKENYTFGNLKKEACDVFNIRKENRKFYHIVNDKFYVYSYRINVWEIHSEVVENNKSTLNWAHMELLDKMSIFMDRNTNINKPEMMKSNLIPEEDIKRVKNSNELNSEETFSSEIEDYVRYYRRIEGVYLFFKKDLEKEAIKKKHFERLENIDHEEKAEIKALEFNDDEDNSESQIKKKFEERRNLEVDKFEEELRKHKNKPEPPIYISIKDIQYFRFAKFFVFFISIIFAFSIYIYINLSGSMDISSTFNIGKYLNDVLLFNPVYKNFMRNDQAYTNKDFENLIRTKEQLLVWLNLVFNNLVINDETEDTINIDTFGNVFNKISSYYEVLSGIRFSFKLSQPFNNHPNQSIFNLSSKISELLVFIDDYKDEREDTDFLNIDGSKYPYLKKYENYTCNRCISKNYITYSPEKVDSILSFDSGMFGFYSGGGYHFNINSNLFNRTIFNEFVSLLREKIILIPECRMFSISINIIHMFFKAITKFDLIFEFSTIGDVKATVNYYVIDTEIRKKPLYYFGRVMFILQIITFTVSLLFRIFSKCIVRKRVKTLSNLPITIDCIILFLLIKLEMDAGSLSELQKTALGDLLEKNEPFSESNISPDQYSFYFKYYELSQMALATKSLVFYCGIIIFLLFLRILFYMMGSPLIYYILVIATKTGKTLFNLIVILFTFILCFSIVLHYLQGTKSFEFSNLSRTFLISVISLLGSLDTQNYGDLSSVDYVIIIAFLIFIKFILMTFIYAIIKETFESVRKEYNKYRKRDHFKLIGETVFMFFRYLLMPISFYYMYKDFDRVHKIYSKVKSLEKFVKEEEIHSIY